MAGEAPETAHQRLAEEIDAMVAAFGSTRLELLKIFWKAERGRAHSREAESENRFKQYMHKARTGKPLCEVGELELRDFLAFLRAKAKRQEA